MRCLSTTLLVLAAAAVLLVIVSGRDRALVKANSKFALRLYRYMTHGHRNVVFSPFSISACMAMVFGGATGSSSQELAGILGYSKLGSSVHRRFRRLLRDFRGGNYTMTLANRIFVNRRIPIQRKFARIAQFYYGAPVKKMDFTRRPAAAARFINNWVATKTNQKITNLLSQANIKSSTNLVIVNALFFRAFWSLPFNKATKATFHLTDSRTVFVDMMSTPRHLFNNAYSQEMRCTVYEVPYVAGDATMYILLPKTADGLAWLEGHLNYRTLQKALRNMKGWTGELRLPKFQVTSSYDLTEVLRVLGLKTSLSNVTLLSSSPSSDGLADVNHKARIDVSEERTDAAAATAAITYRSAFFSFGPAVVIDRPFLFIIKHKTGSILFVGRVLDPTSGV
ncbi:Serpin B6 [Lamellibrachia satsuma]|nr:Serpin B6 [Lamellibrachia satsuma]